MGERSRITNSSSITGGFTVSSQGKEKQVIHLRVKSYEELKDALLEELFKKDLLKKEIAELKEQLAERCGHERPPRKVLCQLPKGHGGSHQAVIYWEDE